MNKNVLLVDDEPSILEGFKRQLRKMYDISTATSGPEALEILQKSDFPFAVIVSDMQMPGMNGIELLKKTKDLNPDTVRIMLTGNADLKTAMDSVNEGHIFRFLTKPCPPKILGSTIMAGIRQFRLVNAERELLERTLSGSVKVLTEILGLINPIAFGHSIRIGRYVEHMVEVLKIEPAWHFKLAATLSQIGCVTIPGEILEKVFNGESLPDNELTLYKSHPDIAKNLIENIPRLGIVARMIEAQGQVFQKRTPGDSFEGEDLVALGGHLITIAMEYERLLMQNKTSRQATEFLALQPNKYLPAAVTALKSLVSADAQTSLRSVMVRDLNTNMILEQDIKAQNGMLIAIKGQEISYTMIQRLKAFANSIGVQEPFQVSMTIT